jgi:hypothetical protein
MNIHKRNVFGLFFLFYFAVYAVSPIIYTLSSGRTSEIIRGKGEVPSFAEGFQVPLVETVWGKFIPREEEQTGGSAVKFLIRKKRAVLPENRLAKMPYPDASFTEEAPPFSSAPFVGRIVEYISNGSGGDHRPLYLCHSPPATLLLLV